MSLTNWFPVPFLLTRPLVVTWFQRDASPVRAPERRRLARWTAASLGLMLLLAGLDAVGAFAWWYELPHLMTHGKRPAEFCWIPTFWLWILAARILGRLDGQVPHQTDHATSRSTNALVAVLILACQVAGLTVAMFTPRLVLREPEPLAPHGALDLAPLYRRYRGRRPVGSFVPTAVMTLGFCGMVCGLALSGLEQILPPRELWITPRESFVHYTRWV